MKTSRLHIMVAPEMLQGLDAHCADQGITRSDAIRFFMDRATNLTSDFPVWAKMEQSVKIAGLNRMIEAGCSFDQIAIICKAEITTVKAFARRHDIGIPDPIGSGLQD